MDEPVEQGDEQPTAFTDPLAETPEEEEVRDSALRSFMGLFVVPLLVVLVCVAIFVGFGWIAYDQNSTQDYLDDLTHWSKPRRSQAAYELAKVLLADPSALDDEPELKQQVRDIYASAENADMKRYLALVLGFTKDPDAIAPLVESLRGDDAELKIYTLWALGTIGDSRALQPVLESLEDRDPGIRKTAAFALGEMGFPEALPRLRARIEDPVADVRWNASLALARLGSDAGLPVLREMVTRDLAGQVPGITAEQQEDAMIEAVKALTVIGGAEVSALLQDLAKNDPSLKVRQAALDGLRALDKAAAA